MLKILAGLSLLTNAVASAQSVRSADMPHDGVVVTRRALTISVPLDTSAAKVQAGEPKVGWDLDVVRDVGNHSSNLRLAFREPLAIATYGVARHPESCRGLTDSYSCRDSATARIANRRLVVTLRDSAMLALLLAGRPTQLWVYSSLESLALRRVTVIYGDPQLLPPSKEALAEYDRVLGREGWSPWTRTMWIASPASADSVWLQVGERREASVRETQGRGIDSENRRSDFSVEGGRRPIRRWSGSHHPTGHSRPSSSSRFARERARSPPMACVVHPMSCRGHHARAPSRAPSPSSTA